MYFYILAITYGFILLSNFFYLLISPLLQRYQHLLARVEEYLHVVVR